MTAVDGDAGRFGSLTYTISGDGIFTNGSRPCFSLDTASGTVLLLRVSDYMTSGNCATFLLLLWGSLPHEVVPQVLHYLAGGDTKAGMCKVCLTSQLKRVFYGEMGRRTDERRVTVARSLATPANDSSPEKGDDICHPIRNFD